MDVRGARLVERREHDDRDGRERGIGLHPALELPAVHHRHHQVEQDDVGPVGAVEVVERLPAVRDRGRVVAFERQQLSHHLAQVLVVFDDEDGAVRQRRRHPFIQRLYVLHRTSRTCKLSSAGGLYRVNGRPIIRHQKSSMLKVSLQSERVHGAAVLVLAVILVFVALFWRLGTPTFWDPDEAHYAETSREMVATGDWWAPFYNEEPFFDKPVLFHQLQGASMLLFDDAELAARFAPALAGLGLVLITAWFGRTMVSADVGIVAGMMLTACPGLFALARYAILDMVFTMFTFGGAAFLAVAALRDRPRLQWLAYVFLALGVLTKGPIALVLCGLTFIIAIAVSADLRRRLLRLHWFVGLLLILALSAPPFVYLYLRFGQAYVDGYVLDENFR